MAARVVGVDERQPIGDHGPAADRAEERVVVLDIGAEVRAGLHDLRQVVPDAAQVVDDVGAVPESRTKNRLLVIRAIRPVRPVAHPVEPVLAVGPDEAGAAAAAR